MQREVLEASSDLANRVEAVWHAYEDYCRSHPDYKNNRCICAVANIKRVYNERLQKHDFS